MKEFMGEPVEWARHVAFELATLRAEMAMVRTLLVQLTARQSGETADQIDARWEPVMKKNAEALYLEILVRCGLPSDLDVDHSGHGQTTG